MVIALTLDSGRDLTIFSVKGELTFEEQMEALRQFYESAPTCNVIWDFSLLEGSRVSSDELREIISFIKRHGKNRPGGGKTALVSSTDLDFGLSRMSQVYADQEKLLWRIESFHSMEEEFDWIDRE